MPEEETEPAENSPADQDEVDPKVWYTETKPVPKPYDPLTHGLEQEE